MASSSIRRIDEIVAKIRAEIRKAEQAKSKPPRPLEGRGGLRGFSTLRHSEDLAKLNRAWALDPRVPLRSHRKWTGNAIVAAKTRVQKLVVGVLEGYLTQEREFSAALVRFLNRVAEWLDHFATTAHADDELLVRRTEIFLQRMQEEQRGLELRIERLREEIRELQREVVARGSASAGWPAAEMQELSTEFVRGSAPLVVDEERYRIYVPALVGSEPILHLPAGRGTLLALLREANLEAHGIEPDPALVEAAVGQGLAAHCGGLSIPEDGALGAIVITETEWMPAPLLRRLIGEAFKALRPDGIVLVEALNPQSYSTLARIAASTRPAGAWGPDELRKLLEAAGFVEVEGDLSAIAPPALDLPEIALPSPTLRLYAENFRRLNDRLFAPDRHYAVGRRPAAAT